MVFSNFSGFRPCGLGGVPDDCNPTRSPKLRDSSRCPGVRSLRDIMDLNSKREQVGIETEMFIVRCAEDSKMSVLYFPI